MRLSRWICVCDNNRATHMFKYSRDQCDSVIVPEIVFGSKSTYCCCFCLLLQPSPGNILERESATHLAAITAFRRIAVFLPYVRFPGIVWKKYVPAYLKLWITRIMVMMINSGNDDPWWWCWSIVTMIIDQLWWWWSIINEDDVQWLWWSMMTMMHSITSL